MDLEDLFLGKFPAEMTAEQERDMQLFYDHLCAVQDAFFREQAQWWNMAHGVVIEEWWQ